MITFLRHQINEPRKIHILLVPFNPDDNPGVNETWLTRWWRYVNVTVTHEPLNITYITSGRNIWQFALLMKLDRIKVFFALFFVWYLISMESATNPESYTTSCYVISSHIKPKQIQPYHMPVILVKYTLNLQYSIPYAKNVHITSQKPLWDIYKESRSMLYKVDKPSITYTSKDPRIQNRVIDLYYNPSLSRPPLSGFVTYRRPLITFALRIHIKPFQ